MLSKLKRLVSLSLIFIVLISCNSHITFADETSNDMARNMVSFFREERTAIDAESISHDEMKMYAVFLSNFYKPGVTKVSDLKGSALAEEVSSKFFGSSGNASEVQKVHDKLYEAVEDGFENGDFNILESTSGSSAISGKAFLKKLGTSKGSIYNVNGRLICDLHNIAMESAFKVIYGIVPELFIKRDGIYSFKGMFIDGFGNIWGSPVSSSGAAVNFTDYVLVLPACINPVVFAGGNSGLKLPVTNSFAMGASMSINPAMLSMSTDSAADVFLPYYNLKSALPSGSSRDNMVSIFGMYSPLTATGYSDGLFTNGVDTFDAYLSYLKSAANEISASKSSIIIAIDSSSVPNDFSIYDNEVEFFTDDDDNIACKNSIYHYFNGSRVLDLNNIYDEMFYFNLTGMSGNASSSSGGSWTDDNSLVKSQKLFYDEGYTLYNNSYMNAPFDAFMLDYYKSSDNLSYLKSKFSGLSDKDAELLRSTFEYKKYSEVTNAKKYNDAFKNIFGTDKLVYNFIKGSEFTNDAYIKNVPWYNFWDSDYVANAAWGLSVNDHAIVVLSQWLNGITWSSDTLKRFNKSCFEAESLGVNTSGGKFANVELTNNHVNQIMNSLINVYNYKLFGMNYEVRKYLDDGVSVGSTMGTYKVYSSIANNTNNWPGIYWSYMHDIIDLKQDENGDWMTPKPYVNDSLPDVTINTRGSAVMGFNSDDTISTDSSDGLSTSQAKTAEDMQKDIITKIYGLLSEEPNQYRDALVKATQDSWVVSTHRSIVGSWLGNSLSVGSGGSNSYTGVVGYINTPTLNDLPLTAWLSSNYMYIYMFLLLIIFVILLGLFVCNIRQWQTCVLIFLLMSFVLLLPFTLLNNVVNLSNSVSDWIYSSKFNYWAITQHQQSISSLQNATDDMSELIAQNMEQAKEMYTQDVGVRLKWMSPKKADTFSSIFNSTVNNPNMATNLSVFKWLFSSFVYGEEYVYGDPLATYLYRPYNNIAQSAKDSYDMLVGNFVDPSSLEADLKSACSGILGFEDYSFELIDERAHNVNFTVDKLNEIDRASIFKGINNDDNYKYWALSNNEITNAIFRNEMEIDDAGIDADSLSSDAEGKAFLLMSESPFYYFYNVFKSRYSDNGSGYGFKNALLYDDIFIVKDDTNSQLNNKVRDFMDMEGLFTNIVPYLKASNDYVYNWTNKYGKNIEDYNFEQGEKGEDFDENAYSEAKAKKEAMKRVWYMYSPWVDQLYSLDVYNKKVSIAKKRLYADNILDPSALDYIGRPMIFSEADMTAKNYRVSDLTDIEFRIQKVLDDTHEDLMKLVNYYDFDDEVLITAAAMLATFNFNKEFSQYNLIGESHMLYPQSFELKNFNYDSFLRLTLMNSTGESLMGEKDLYVRILDKTSFFTGVFLIVKDILAVYVIPALKLSILLALVVLGLLLCLTCVINPPEKIVDSVLNSLVYPALLFGLACVTFSFIVSLFVGEGLTYYVGGSGLSLATNDPTITIVMLIVVDVVFIICLIKILKGVFKAYKNFGVSTLFGALGIVTGVGSLALNAVKDRTSLRRQGKQIAKGMHQGMNGYNTSSSTKDYSGVAGHNSGVKRKSTGSSVDKVKSNVLTSYINNLSRNNPNIRSSTNNTSAKRTLGTRAINLKYGIRNSIDNVGYSARTLGSDISGATKRAGIKVRDLATGKTIKRYVDNNKVYERDLLKQRLNDYKKAQGAGKHVNMSSYKKDTRKYAKLNKVKASNVGFRIKAKVINLSDYRK